MGEEIAIELEVFCRYGQFVLNHRGQQYIVTITQDLSEREESYGVTVTEPGQRVPVWLPNGKPADKNHILVGRFTDWTEALEVAAQKVAILEAERMDRMMKEDLQA